MTGRIGMTGVHTILEVDDDLSELLGEGAGTQAVADFAYLRGARSLLDEALEKSRNGSIEIARFLEIAPETPAHFLKFAGRDFKAMTAQAIKVGESSVGGSGEGSMSRRRPEGSTSRTQNERGDRPLLLVVEDDPDQRSILEMILRSAKYEVTLARDGREALDAVKNRRPDLIISDLMMPGIDGSELVRMLKAEKEYRNIPVLVLTVIADVEKEFQLLELGADDYCEKSIQRKIFLKRVENLIRRSRTA
jgi:CheY-like chemotaxis protein